MINRIKLTREDFQPTMDGVLIKYNSNIIKLILEDQEFRERIMSIIPSLKFDKLKNLLEKAEKWRKLMESFTYDFEPIDEVEEVARQFIDNEIRTTHKLYEENKQLKEKVSFIETSLKCAGCTTNYLKDIFNQLKQDAEKWRKLNSGFQEPVDWNKIQFVAVSEYKHENPIITEFNTHNDCLEQENKQLKERIKQNEKLREKIVDLADIWDGKESIKYGTSLGRILKECNIHDVPRFYLDGSIDSITKEIIGEQNL